LGNSYDSCSIPAYVVDPDIAFSVQTEIGLEAAKYCDDNPDVCRETGTGWSGMWSFNGVIMIIQGVNFTLMACGACFWYPRLIGAICNCGLSCCHLAAWITIFAARFSPLGNYCWLNIAGNQLESKNNFTDDYTY